MKKILTVSLALCLLVALVASFAVSAAAEEVEVSVGTRFEWNDQADVDKTAWRTSKGKSPDGLWKYQYYAFNKGVYGDLCYMVSNNFCWNSTPGDNGIGYARVREHGANFHPAELADVVKTFTCPSGGTVTLETTIRRAFDWVTGNATPTSFAIYVEDQLVYPTDGSEYVTITSATDMVIDPIDVEVAKNQRIYFRVGCVDGDQAGDAVYMSNYVTYKAVNDTEEEVTDVTLTNTNNEELSDPYADLTMSTDNVVNSEIADKVQSEKEEAAASTQKTNVNKDDEGSSMGLIIGIVAAVVVVAGVAVAVVIVKKKK